MQEFDIVIIGGGPGGYVGAIRAAQLGAKAALIEKDTLGGTCLNRGCIPTKALYYSAKTISTVKKAAEFGVSTGEIAFDIAKAVERKDDVVKRRATPGFALPNSLNGACSVYDRNRLH